jgi:hypothetical protein
MGRAEGKSKKDAEQRAASVALATLEQELESPPPPGSPPPSKGSEPSAAPHEQAAGDESNEHQEKTLAPEGETR